MVELDPFPVAFDGKYYDINKFLRDHPGGVNTLKHFKGKSITQAMENIGHSVSAYHMLGDLKLKPENIKDSNLTGEVSENGRIITNGDCERNIEEIAFLEELESRLDWSKPILNQLGAISSHYERWVNTAVYRQCRLFENPLLEAMTYTPWYMVPIFWIPTILYMGVTQYMNYVSCGDACQEPPLSTLRFCYHLGLGVLLWTILEYSIHRWVFHLNPGSSVTMMKIHFILHGMHHKVPFDSYRQVFPPIPASVIAAIIFTIIKPFITYPMLKLVGGLTGYLIYDMIHVYVHHGSPKDGTYLYAMKRYHSNHHFVNHDKAFGISSKLWDYVFMTVVCIRKLGYSLSWKL